MWNTVVLLLVVRMVRIEAEDVNSDLLRTMFSYMDLEQPPCERFYEYACGNWERQQGENSSNSYVDVIGSLEYNANRQLAELIEERARAHKIETLPLYAKVRVYYETCLENSIQAGQELERYLELLKPAHNVEWPVVGATADTANIAYFRWTHTLGRLRAIGLNDVLMQLKLENRNASSYILQLGRPTHMSWDKHAQQELSLLQPAALADQVKQLNHKLQQLWRSTSASQPLTELSLSELQHRLPMLDVSDYLKQLYGAPLPPETPILVRSLSYLRKLSDLLSKTSSETILHLLRLQLLVYLRREQPRSNTPEHCVGHQRGLMSLALDYINERERYRYVRQETDAVINRIFKSIQSKFIEFLEEHTADLNEEELEFLQKKMQHMQLNIGNLPKGVNADYYSEYYAGLDVLPGYFQWNHLNALQHRVFRELQRLLLPSTAPEHSFNMWPYGSPAYDQQRNRLLIPHAYLQLPIFHRKFHELFLYAELGNTLGHEIMHAFDPIGLQYDADGAPSMLFMDAVRRKEHLLNALRCLSRNPTSNLNEKLADFSGFRLAYESHFGRHGLVPKFRAEGLEEANGLTNQQLFFIKFAQFFCAVSPQRIVYDSSHDTPFERVPQTLANHVAFAREFNCGVHSRMYVNASQRCIVW
ncbi:membrane metallo-endopeptidase-like 1 [Scaptodrosophila lebanonensis]|uniref:Membrane metallo-endopeptidase-like 1 n=1 Tax=Drosophila lebanonensis TaxID=7225 RepID=A0A6J2TKR6_DROLE|nr:membrane metallo-endopeptidase-like 1 [Scaptodrosophila lebanonensis]